MNQNVQLVKVNHNTKPRKAAGAIASMTREDLTLEIHAIGAACVNITAKAVAIANTFLEDDRVFLVMIPSFGQVMIGDQERTSMVFSLKKFPIE